MKLDKIDNLSANMSNVSVRLTLSPSNTAREAFLYAQETGYLEVDPSYCVELDNLNSFLILFVVMGEGKLLYENDEYLLESGDLFYIDCKKYHKYYATNKKGWRILYLYFNGKQARGNYKVITKGKSPILKVMNSKIVSSIFWQIISLHQKHTKFSELHTSLQITKLLTEISMLGEDEAVVNVEYPPYIHYVFHHIDHYFDEKITLNMLSELYGVSKFHLSREFKRYSGLTINEYIIAARINRAKTLLRYSHKTIEKIAEEVGFYSASHFIKLFHKREYMTPQSYRNQWTK